MFALLYPVFLVALFFARPQLVVLVWLGLALANMAVQYAATKRARVQKGLAGVLVASLFLWPVQFAAAVSSSQTDEAERRNAEAHRKTIGTLPATVKGRVSYAHHHGTEEGHDSVWLDEFGDLDFMTDSRTFDRIGIEEGKLVSLTIEERDAPHGLKDGKALWIVDGESSTALASEDPNR